MIEKNDIIIRNNGFWRKEGAIMLMVTNSKAQTIVPPWSGETPHNAVRLGRGRSIGSETAKKAFDVLQKG